jgi:predicted transcriptional regulator of viral defense system
MESRPQVVQGVQRLKGIFLEVPGTRLTLADAMELSGLDQAMCEMVLAALEDASFLRRVGDGRYQRRTLDSPLYGA